MEFVMPKNQNSIIKVIGVGGGGGNAVNNMFLKGIIGVDFIICNTDAQALESSPIPNKVRLGVNKTEGLGAGANPEVGRISAMESLEQVKGILKNNTKMVFVTAGMGGGTGTGGAPVIAGLAKELGILTVAIVTTPFRFEGKKRMAQAMEGIKELQKNVDTLLVITNDNLTKIFGNNVTMKKAFEEADHVLCDAAKGIAEIITREGYINVDFADVQTIMKDGGTALMGTACYEGEDRAIRAAEDAISSPMLDNVSIEGSRGILVNITAAEDSLRLDETTQIIEHIQEAAGDNADIIFGTVYDPEMGEKLSVTVIATGFQRREDGKEEVKKTIVDVSKPDPISHNLNLTANPFPAELFAPPKKENEHKAPPVERREEPRQQPRQEPRQEPAINKEESELEERMRKLKNSDFNFHDPEKLRGLEEIPAYLRKQVSLDEPEKEAESKKLSRVSIDEVYENKYELSDNNSFLHDNVD